MRIISLEEAAGPIEQGHLVYLITQSSPPTIEKSIWCLVSKEEAERLGQAGIVEEVKKWLLPGVYDATFNVLGK